MVGGCVGMYVWYGMYGIDVGGVESIKVPHYLIPLNTAEIPFSSLLVVTEAIFDNIEPSTTINHLVLKNPSDLI